LHPYKINKFLINHIKNQCIKYRYMCKYINLSNLLRYFYSKALRVLTCRAYWYVE
jgi:hypothetical protein